MRRFNGDVVLARELVDIFLEECPRLMERIRRTIAAQDPKPLLVAVRDLMASVQYFESADANQATLQLEALARSGSLTEAGKMYDQLVASLAELHRRLAPV